MKRPQLAVYGLIVAVAAFSLWRVDDTANRADVTAHRLDREAEVRADEQCVTAWEVREDIRDAIQKGAEAHQQALLEAFDQLAEDPVKFRRFAELYRGTLVDEFNRPGGARQQIPNPSCDLTAARARLER